MDTDSKLDDVNNGGGDEEEEQEVVDVDNGWTWKKKINDIFIT
jgi:hypothetical protein